MNKSAAITALAFSALALASCSTEETNVNSADTETANQTTAQAPAETAESESPEETTAEQTSTTAPTYTGRFDEAAIKSGLEGLGYQCDDHNDCTKTEGANIYEIDIDDDDLDAEVQGNEDLSRHFETILSDVGTAFGEYDFGGSNWDEIQTWALSAADDEETVIGNVELEHDLGDDDGVPNRELSIELLNS